MSGPLIFISHSKVKPGKLEQYRGHVQEATEVVESEEPRMIAFNSYASDDGVHVSTVQVHPDADSLDAHLKIFAEKLQARAFDALESSEINVYGAPSDATRQQLEQMPDLVPGMQVRILPVHESGFLRPQPL